MGKRLLTVALAVLVALLLVEVSLRAAAAIVSRVALRDEEASAASGQKFRIFTIGDSNTYGAGLPRDQAYPAHLERILNASAGADRFEVVNLGVPGSNSAQVAERLPQYIRTYRPDVLVVLTGVNDYWNPAEVEEEEAGARTGLHRALSELRTYRLLLLVVDYFRWGAGGGAGVTDATLKTTQLRKDAGGKADATIHELRIGDETFAFRNPRRSLLLTDEEHAKLLRSHLEEIIDIAQRARIPLVLPTYAADMGHYRVVNEEIVKTPSGDGVTVVPTAFDVLVARVPSLRTAKDRFFPDLHPKGVVYSAFALSLCDGLVKNGLIPLDRCIAPDANADAAAAAS